MYRLINLMSVTFITMFLLSAMATADDNKSQLATDQNGNKVDVRISDTRDKVISKLDKCVQNTIRDETLKRVQVSQSRRDKIIEKCEKLTKELQRPSRWNAWQQSPTIDGNTSDQQSNSELSVSLDDNIDISH